MKDIPLSARSSKRATLADRTLPYPYAKRTNLPPPPSASQLPVPPRFPLRVFGIPLDRADAGGACVRDQKKKMVQTRDKTPTLVSIPVVLSYLSEVLVLRGSGVLESTFFSGQELQADHAL